MTTHKTQTFQRWHPKYWVPWGLIALLFLLCKLPYRLQLWLGRGIGHLIYWTARRDRNVAETNIALCFPDMTAQQQKRMLKQHFLSLGIAVFEMGLACWARPERILSLVHSAACAPLDDAIKKGQGVMMLAPHFTCIQICARMLTLRYPVSIVYRPHKNPFINHFFEKIYANAHNMIPRHNVRLLARTLKSDKGLVCFTPDVDSGRKRSVFAPFFGINTATTITPVVMARRTTAAIVPVYCHRMPRGKGYRFHCGEALQNFPSDDIEQDITRINQIMEQMIRQHPEQYLWVYKRFKSRPHGEQRIY